MAEFFFFFFFRFELTSAACAVSFEDGATATPAGDFSALLNELRPWLSVSSVWPQDVAVATQNNVKGVWKC